MEAGFLLDALEQALYDRRPVENNGLIHHSDRGAFGPIAASATLLRFRHFATVFRLSP